MNVLMAGAYPPPYGGLQVHMVLLRNFLMRRRWTCSFINLTRHRKINCDGVYYPRTALGVAWLLCILRYDVIHIHIGGDLPFRLMGLCLLCSWIPGKRVILTFHSGGYPSSKEGKSAHPMTIRGFVLRRLDGLVAVNAEIAKVFLQYGARRERVRVISPYAFPEDLSDLSVPDFLQEFMKSHSPLLTTVGLLEPEYDLMRQVDVLGKVRNRWPNAGLVIIGSGSMEQQLRVHIKSKPYAHHALLCGDVSHPVTLRVMGQSDLFLRTTLYDGDALSVREALQLGVPTIATNNGMRPEGAVLVPAADSEALEMAIEAKLSCPTPHLQRKISDGENLQLVLDFYEELLSGSIPRTRLAHENQRAADARKPSASHAPNQESSPADS